MAAPTMDRQRTASYRRVATGQINRNYRNHAATGTAVSLPDYTRPYARPLPELKPLPKTAPKRAAVPEKTEERAYNRAKRKQIWRTFFQIAGVFIMCSLMIYRYAVILENNERIAELDQKIAQMEYDNQYLAAKLDSALELGALETYATEELGMMRPDTSQMFYVDVTMEDTTVVDDEGGQKSLQGAPGALVHAIRVLK